LSAFLAGVGVFLIGLSKAGFATGLGMLSTPLVAQAFPARQAVGLTLPLLCLADVFTLAVYWRQWDWRLVKAPLVGTFFGILAAMGFVTAISDAVLRRSIGVVGLVLTLLLLVRNRWHPDHVYRPSALAGVAVGCAAGFASAIAHAAGPILALYLLAQRVEKRVFVASSGLFFAANNLMKLPPYVRAGLIDATTLHLALGFAALIPAGIAAGWLANRHIPQKHFDAVVTVLMLVTSAHLCFG